MDTPRWDLGNVFPGLESKEFAEAVSALDRKLSGMEGLLARKVEAAGKAAGKAELAALAAGLVTRLNDLYDRIETLGAYLASFTSTDSFDVRARKLESELDGRRVRLRKVATRARRFLGRIGPRLPAVLEESRVAAAHAYFLRREAEQAAYMMGEAEEGLAAELAPSGADAWGRLQRTVTAQLAVEFETGGTARKMPMPELINLRTHPDGDVRRRAYEAELAAWETVKEPLAAALNGVKGVAGTLDRLRGRKDCLHASLDAAHIDRRSLEAMLASMRDSFPDFRRYFRSKAAKLGRKSLAWYDLFAPMGAADRVYSWSEAREFILSRFGSFAPELEALARRAFDGRWIDAEVRRGKRGGAFCMGVPAVRESRVFCNYDGTLEQLSTLAHELGHAFHNECAYAAGKTSLQQDTPMTLAETASILCETVVNEAVLAQAGDPKEVLAVLETSLCGSAQVIVDIYSRFLFEKEVFERRAGAELSAEDFCGAMERAQAEAYGDGLDGKFLHRYMWTWKPHYYSADLSFYNYPYAFGLLLATGLYAVYRERGASFVSDYRAFLASTGEAPAAELAARFGIDIRRRAFWDASLAVIRGQIDRYCAL